MVRGGALRINDDGYAQGNSIQPPTHDTYTKLGGKSEI